MVLRIARKVLFLGAVQGGAQSVQVLQLGRLDLASKVEQSFDRNCCGRGVQKDGEM